MKRVWNFNAGPSPMPLSVLEEIREEMTDYRGCGMGIIEMSHRSKEFQSLLAETKALLTELMDLRRGQEIVFIQGGGSMQFVMEAYNFSAPARPTPTPASGRTKRGTRRNSSVKPMTPIPRRTGITPTFRIPMTSAPVRIISTSRRTTPSTARSIGNFQSKRPRGLRHVQRYPLPPDRLQPICPHLGGHPEKSRRSRHSARRHSERFPRKARADVPEFLRYRTFVEKDSAYNTPAVFCIYTLNKMLHWIKNMGGAEAMEVRNKKKADTLYQVIDESGGFYRGHAEKPSAAA